MAENNDNPDNRKRIESYKKRSSQLKNERTGMISLWSDLADYLQPSRGKFLQAASANKNAPKRNTKMINNKARLALRICAAGMFTGITSPARPWFRITTGDSMLDEIPAVKRWIEAVQKKMYSIFNGSNFYDRAHTMYLDMGAFGNGVMCAFQDYDRVVRFKTYPIGSYMAALGGDDRLDTLYFEYQRTAGQLVKEFGEDNVSTTVKTMWQNGASDKAVNILHVIEPNDERDQNSPFNNNMAIRSVYLELDSHQDRFLRESGFETFPGMMPRWEAIGEEIYSSDCPGMLALGDARALQLAERRKYQVLDRLTDPPLQGGMDIFNKLGGKTPMPGEMIQTTTPDGLKSIYTGYNPDLKAILEICDRTESRISSAFYEDLFLMLANDTRSNITATEVAERHEEKLQQLGPMLQRVHNEFLDPLIERVFTIMNASGIVPPAPQELADKKLNIEYISVLAQAQKLVAISGLERTLGFAANLAAVWPEARHKVNAQEAVDQYANAWGVPTGVVRSDDEVEEMAMAEQQAMEQQKQIMQSQQTADIAKTASETNTEGNNGLTAMLRTAGLTP